MNGTAASLWHLGLTAREEFNPGPPHLFHGELHGNDTIPMFLECVVCCLCGISKDIQLDLPLYMLLLNECMIGLQL